jgi:tetratricopeptide (TPR) repeat protein
MTRSLHARMPLVVLTGLLILGVGLIVSRLFGPDTGAASPPQPELRAPESTKSGDAREHEIAKNFEQGVMMLHAERYDYAVVALHRVLQLAPRMPEAHANMGFALLGQGQHKAARDFFESAIAIRPAQVNAYYGLAVTLERACDLPGAIGAMRTYLHLDEGDEAFARKARSALWEWETALGAAADAGDPNGSTQCAKGD